MQSASPRYRHLREFSSSLQPTHTILPVSLHAIQQAARVYKTRSMRTQLFLSLALNFQPILLNSICLSVCRQHKKAAAAATLFLVYCAQNQASNRKLLNRVNERTSTHTHTHLESNWLGAYLTQLLLSHCCCCSSGCCCCWFTLPLHLHSNTQTPRAWFSFALFRQNSAQMSSFGCCAGKKSCREKETKWESNSHCILPAQTWVNFQSVAALM